MGLAFTDKNVIKILTIHEELEIEECYDAHSISVTSVTLDYTQDIQINNSNLYGIHLYQLFTHIYAFKCKIL